MEKQVFERPNCEAWRQRVARTANEWPMRLAILRQGSEGPDPNFPLVPQDELQLLPAAWTDAPLAARVVIV